MKVYRLTKKTYLNDLSGTGAEIAGGRWNYKGTKVVYTAESRALCTAEIAVHTPFGVVPDDYYLMTINIPDTIKIESIQVDKLPEDWKKFPNKRKTQDLGEEFIKKRKYLVLKAPSAVVQGEPCEILLREQPFISQGEPCSFPTYRYGTGFPTVFPTSGRDRLYRDIGKRVHPNSDKAHRTRVPIDMVVNQKSGQETPDISRLSVRDRSCTGQVARWIVFGVSNAD